MLSIQHLSKRVLKLILNETELNKEFYPKQSLKYIHSYLSSSRDDSLPKQTFLRSTETGKCNNELTLEVKENQKNIFASKAQG